ncbi:DUF3769 domain-containing protein [Anabaena sp. UHCC 0451]|uniref:DUF3769 domain-containing protein n=1 Tax=Anabaena sp. UHCC 0451 TaxID=2055235 RepID=UPI002B209C35|nr:DUF3769 domain-containing protein [Anabaena sp. UHCC 0451]MEA5574941.1 DUF3769 domain-containing protein [Anabaena sp. UHCC 0451]
MLHPVLPPDSLPVQEYIQPANPLSSTPVVEDETGKQEFVIPGNIEISDDLATPTQTNPYNLVVVKPLSSSPVPETLPPEFSPLTVSKSASLLGTSLKVANSQMETVDADNSPAATVPQISGEVVNHKKLLLSEAPVVIETPAPVQQKNYVNIHKLDGKINISGETETGKNIPSSFLVQNIIEFKPRSPDNQPSTSTTVEFPPTPESTLPADQPAGDTPEVRKRIVEVTADRQEYDEQRRIVTAEGNVVVRFDGAVIDADRLQVNLDNLIAVGEGNIALTRGNQILRGERFTYNFVQDSGDLENGRGEIYIPSTQTDFALSPSVTTDITAGGVPSRPPSDRIRANQPVTGVGSPGGINVTVGGQADASNIPGSKTGGIIKRMRFEAQRIDFNPRGWQAEDVRITNDPFSPPELELRASKVTLTKEAPLVDRITTQNQRLVFDQNVSLPIPIDNQKIDRRERDINPFIVSPGFDNGKRGGLFVERNLRVVNTDKTRWNVTPQFFVQKAFEDGGNFTDFLGVKTKLNSVLGPKTTVEGKGELTSLDVNKIEDELRGSLRLRQTLGEVNPHTLNLEYSYRDRLYNGTLGFQTVQSSLGAVITSPIIPLGKSGINLSYQGGTQYITANTDRPDLLEPQRQNDRISLGRLQGSVALGTGFLLWQGKPLAPTATEGLKYTPNPVVPYLQAIAGVTGTTSYYTSGDNQSTLIGTVGLVGQVGHFSRPFFDYTAFNVSYSQGFNSGLSPFLFDRSVDNRVLSAGISQQIYGPFRLGLQTSVNLDTGQESSTDYIMEYNRRTYGITLRYNPVLELGGFTIRISDFNWTGGTDPFSDGEVKPVVNGVRQGN